jgi:hypothetical protein
VTHAPGRSPTFKKAAEHVFFGAGGEIASIVSGTVRSDRGQELGRGCGGGHCMTCAIVRDA